MSLGQNFDAVLSAAKAGAEWAWAALYRDLAGPVKGYLAARGAADPEDLAAEVFYQLARDISRFQGDEAAFRSWVFVVTHRRLVDSWRAAGRRTPQTPLEDLVLEPEGGDAETEAVDRLATRELLAAFEKLSDDQRAVVTLRIIGGLTLQETADVLGKRVGAIKALQRRGLMALKDSLPKVE